MSSRANKRTDLRHVFRSEDNVELFSVPGRVYFDVAAVVLGVLLELVA